MSVRRAQEEISSREFVEWLAFDSIDPGEPVRGDLNAALICSIIANVNRDPKRRARPYEPKDFMWEFPAQPKRTSAKELRAKFEAWRTMYQGSLDKKKAREEKQKVKTAKAKAIR